MINPPRDIRNSVPQINPTWLPPPPIGAPYPKMMIVKDDPKKTPHKHADGRPVIVQNEKEEAAFWAKLEGEKPQAPKAMSVSAEAEVEKAAPDVNEENDKPLPKLSNKAARATASRKVLPD